MNLANVKGITIPEGAVKTLSIGGVKVWSAVTVDKYSWEGVFASIDAGTYATDYDIGDTIPLDLGSEGVINMQIAAFDVDNLADGSGKAPVTFIAKELLATSKRMNPERFDSTEGTGTIGGWEKSEMRAYLKNDIKPLIAESVANRIATVTKTQAAFDTNRAKFTQTTEESVWIPDREEIVSDGGIYTALFADQDSRIKCKVGEANASYWWMRGAWTDMSFACISDVGELYAPAAQNAHGVCLSFCLA